MKFLPLLITAICCSPLMLSAQSVEPAFTADNPNATVEGQLLGDHYADYVAPGLAGKTLSVSLIPQGTAYFNILPPGSEGEAIYNSSIDGNDAAVVLDADGDYTVRVYLMGADADGEKIISYLLIMGMY